MAWLMEDVTRHRAENAEVVRIRAENQELRSQLARNSQNSFKPPSSDPPSVERPKAVEVAEAHVRAQAVVHPDETGWREHGQRRWLWTATTGTLPSSASTAAGVPTSRSGSSVRTSLA